MAQEAYFDFDDVEAASDAVSERTLAEKCLDKWDSESDVLSFPETPQSEAAEAIGVEAAMLDSVMVIIAEVAAVRDRLAAKHPGDTDSQHQGMLLHLGISQEEIRAKQEATRYAREAVDNAFGEEFILDGSTLLLEHRDLLAEHAALTV